MEVSKGNNANFSTTYYPIQLKYHQAFFRRKWFKVSVVRAYRSSVFHQSTSSWNLGAQMGWIDVKLEVKNLVTNFH